MGTMNDITMSSRWAKGLSRRQRKEASKTCKCFAFETTQQISEIRRKALLACRDQFQRYVELHKAKGTPEGDAKAATNAEFVKLCDEAMDAS